MQPYEIVYICHFSGPLRFQPSQSPLVHIMLAPPLKKILATPLLLNRLEVQIITLNVVFAAHWRCTEGPLGHGRAP